MKKESKRAFCWVVMMTAAAAAAPNDDVVVVRLVNAFVTWNLFSLAFFSFPSVFSFRQLPVASVFCRCENVYVFFLVFLPVNFNLQTFPPFLFLLLLGFIFFFKPNIGQNLFLGFFLLLHLFILGSSKTLLKKFCIFLFLIFDRFNFRSKKVSSKHLF